MLIRYDPRIVRASKDNQRKDGFAAVMANISLKQAAQRANASTALSGCCYRKSNFNTLAVAFALSTNL
jgi:hypothetical protein